MLLTDMLVVKLTSPHQKAPKSSFERHLRGRRSANLLQSARKHCQPNGTCNSTKFSSNLRLRIFPCRPLRPIAIAADAVLKPCRVPFSQLLSMKAEDVHKWVQQLQRDEQALRYRLSIVQKELAARAAGSRGGTIGVDPEQLANMDKERDAKLQELAALREQHDKVKCTLL